MRNTLIVGAVMLAGATVGVSLPVQAMPEQPRERVSATFLVFPSAHPEEDLYDCASGWVEDAYTAQDNGGATVTCVQLFPGETRDAYYAARNWEQEVTE